MSSWKEKILSTLALCAVMTGISIIYSMHMTVRAQEPAAVEGEGEYGLIVDEALDQVEQALEPLPVEPMGETAPVPTDAMEAVVEETVLPAPDETDETILPTEETVQDLEISDLPAVSEGTSEPEPVAQILPEVPEEALEAKMIPLFHAEAAGLMEALNGMKSGSGKIEYKEEDRALLITDTSERLQAMEVFIKQADIPLDTETFDLEGPYDGSILEKIKNILTRDIGQVHADPEKNSIVVTDTPAKIAEINALMAELFPSSKEVVLEARALQIILNDEHPSGVDWEAIVSGYQKAAFVDLDAGTRNELSIGTLSQEDYDILLEALDTVGIVRVILENKIVGASGKLQTVDILLSALRDAGEDGKATDIVLDQGDLERSSGIPEEKKVRFCVTPTIKNNAPISVSIIPKFFRGISSGSEDGTPVTVGSADGSIIVIGGLFKDIPVTSAWKIPLLGDLPFLGFVFRNEGEDLRKTETVTFLAVTAVEKKEQSEE